jgi:hypothetical protein
MYVYVNSCRGAHRYYIISLLKFRIKVEKGILWLEFLVVFMRLLVLPCTRMNYFYETVEKDCPHHV